MSGATGPRNTILLLLVFLAAVAGSMGGVYLLDRREAARGPTPAAEGAAPLLTDSLQQAHLRIEELVRERDEGQTTIERLRGEIAALEKGTAAARQRADELEKEALGLRDVLLEEELRFRSIIEGLRQYELLPTAAEEARRARTEERAVTTEPPPGMDDLIARARPVEEVFPSGEPSAPVENPRPTPPVLYPEVAGDEAKSLLNRVLGDSTASDKVRFRGLGGVASGQIRDVEVEQVDGGGRLARVLRAKSARFFVSEEAGTVELLLEEGELTQGGMTIPFFEGRYRLAVTGIDPGQFASRTASLFAPLETP